MSKYKRKPIIVEVVHFTKRFRKNSSLWPKWFDRATFKDKKELGAIWYENSIKKILCRTLEGEVIISVNDWIIQGAKGEIFPCKPDIFKLIYEKVLDN